MSLPTDFGTGTVTGHWVTSRGLNGRGQVVFTPRANFMVSGATETIVLPTPVAATLRGGAISVVLPATDDPHISPVGWTWKVECNIDGYIPQPDWTESRDLIVRLLDVIASLTATHSPPTTPPTEGDRHAPCPVR